MLGSLTPVSPSPHAAAASSSEGVGSGTSYKVRQQCLPAVHMSPGSLIHWQLISDQFSGMSTSASALQGQALPQVPTHMRPLQHTSSLAGACSSETCRQPPLYNMQGLSTDTLVSCMARSGSVWC
jgi:hypothetical protein